MANGTASAVKLVLDLFQGLLRLCCRARRGGWSWKIPPEFTDLKEPLSVTPHAVEEAFVKANPGLSASAMAIGCDARRLTEVRLCLSKDLHFRDCAEIAKRSCNREQLTMPPTRGG